MATIIKKDWWKHPFRAGVSRTGEVVIYNYHGVLLARYPSTKQQEKQQ